MPLVPHPEELLLSGGLLHGLFVPKGVVIVPGVPSGKAAAFDANVLLFEEPLPLLPYPNVPLLVEPLNGHLL